MLKQNISSHYLFFLFILILLIFFVFASWLITSQQRDLLIKNEKQRNNVEFELIGEFISEAFLKHDYIAVRQFLLDWSAKRKHIVTLTATAKNGFSFVNYTRQNMTKNTYSIKRRLLFSQDNFLVLEINNDLTLMNAAISKLNWQLLIIFSIIMVLLGFILWITLTKIALIPLEKEVNQRTEELQKEIIGRKKIEHDLIALNQEKNEFLGIVAHDLKNPLSAIKGYSEEIEEYCHKMSAEEIMELTDLIKQVSANMFVLITNLLDVNQIESGNINLDLTNVNVLPIVENITKNYAKIAKEKNIELHLTHTGDTFNAYADTQIVGQILDNLISNAVKYSAWGENIYINLVANTKKIYCEVKNKGQGLSVTDQKKLFGKFKRLSAKPTGGEHSTGLGLFIVKKLTEAINAKIWCESELNKGTTFVVEFSVKT